MRLDQPLGPLSLRERQVLAELAQGKTNKEIARALRMTARTVRFHLQNIFQKLQVKTRTEALAKVLRPPGHSAS